MLRGIKETSSVTQQAVRLACAPPMYSPSTTDGKPGDMSQRLTAIFTSNKGYGAACDSPRKWNRMQKKPGYELGKLYAKVYPDAERAYQRHRSFVFGPPTHQALVATDRRAFMRGFREGKSAK